MSDVQIFTDGACKGNPGPGGWGVLLRRGNTEKELSGAEGNTTNNRMEMTAAIEGLSALKRACTVDLYTDSKYLIDGITKWLPGWQKRGWKTASKQPVKNEDLWRALDEAQRAFADQQRQARQAQLDLSCAAGGFRVPEIQSIYEEHLP